MSPSETYDLVILGGGAAAFAAITEADRRDRSTALVNTGLPLGGTCVNVGCVPSKHLLEVGKTAFEPPRTPFNGVSYDDDQPRIDWPAAIDEKDDLVAALRQENYVNVAERFDTDVYEGYGRFVDDTTIEIVPDGAEADPARTDAATRRITGERALIATGSSPRIPPIEGIEDVPYETSETILERRTRPESVVMLGGGYVGLEWGQLLSHMGADVTILQRSAHVLSGMEPQLGRAIEDAFEAEGIEVVTGVHVQSVARSQEATPPASTDDVNKEDGSGITVTADLDGNTRTVTASDLFVATGVRPNTDDIGLSAIGVETDDSGAIVVDDTYRTANADVYAAGDCIGQPMLETVAAKEGNHAVRNAFDGAGVTVDYDAVPAVVFTSPEVATVGTTEAAYMAAHGTCSCRTVELEDVPKARAVRDTRGLVQVVRHHETDEIVGVHMVGPRAADMIPEATLAVKFGLTVEDIVDTVHPFPTFSEAFKYACQAFRRDISQMSCCVE